MTNNTNSDSLYHSNSLYNSIPEMKTGNALVSALTVLPEYDESVRKESQAARLMALQNLYGIYIPSQMSLEIYSKLYLALLRSLQKKFTKEAIQQRYQNHNIITGGSGLGIVGGSDSFTIIGCSGIGKSSAINRAIAMITENRIVEVEKPYTQIVPCLVVQTPFDSSPKGLLLEILRMVDAQIGSTYYQSAAKSRSATTDMLIGLVSSVALNHIGMLIVDEIQNVVNSKNGRNLVGLLTQLINNSGISIGMVGTPESAVFFEKEMQLARRSVGLYYDTLCYDSYFESFCKTVFGYQYVQKHTDISAVIIEWLYEHSGGIVSVVVSLLHDAQEIAILNGLEVLNLTTLQMAYQQRMSMLHGYLGHTGTKLSTVRKTAAAIAIPNTDNNAILMDSQSSIVDFAMRARSEGADIVSLLKSTCTVEEVNIG